MNNILALTVIEVPKKADLLILPESVAKRDDLIKRINAIEQVAGETSQRMAYAVFEEGKAWLKTVESERKQVKEPAVAFGRLVDDAAKEMATKVKAALDVLDRKLSVFQEELRRQQAEAERKQREELERLAKEREAALARAAAAEAQSDAKAVEAAHEAALQADLKAAEAISVPQVVVPRAEGMKVVERWVTTVEDPSALYKVFPDLVSLVPKMREINSTVSDMAKQNPPDQPPSLPGCTIRKETKVQ